MNNYYAKNGLPATNGRFVEVKGEDGTFYDFVATPGEIEKHLSNLAEEGYQAKTISYKLVPPCVFRYFLHLNLGYTEASWDDGKDFYICKSDKDCYTPYTSGSPKIPLNLWAHKNRISPDTATQKARRGKLKTAELIGRQWFIDPNEPNIDNRIKSGKYIKQN